MSLSHSCKKAFNATKQAGFTMIELAIVMIIVALLVAGILVGQDVLRSAQIKSVIIQTADLRSAINTFKDTYLSLPGDMVNATDYWQASACSGAEVSIVCEDTEDGDGDGLIEKIGVDEDIRAWQHLKLAGILTGAYTGVWENGDIGNPNNKYELDLNIPSANAGSGGGYVISGDGSVDSGSYAAANYPTQRGNYLELANWRVGGTFQGQRLGGAYLNTDDARHLDFKIDDGRPKSGKVWGSEGVDNVAGPNLCSVGSAGQEEYRENDNLLSCRMWIWVADAL